MEEKANIRISLNGGELEISGSEDFVNQQIENFKSLILKSVEEHSEYSSKDLKNNPEEQTNSDSNGKIASYRALFDYDEETIKILKHIPGDSAKQRMVNAAILYLYGKSLKFDNQKAPFSDIREICVDHGFLDSNNFSRSLNKANELLNCSGSGKSQEAKLTFPGKQEAKKLAQEILNDES